MSIITQRFDTGLRNLKGTETGARRQPPITKSIPDSRTSLGIGANLSLQVSKRVDDAERMTRLLGRPEGIKFIANQALLNQSALNSAITRGERPSGTQAAIGAARTAGVPASAIAQSGVSSSGLRFIQGGLPANGGYLSEGSLVRGALASLNPFGSGDNQIAKGGIALRGNPINDFSVRSDYNGFRGINEGTKAGFQEVEKAKSIHITPENIYLGERKGGIRPRDLLLDSSFKSKYEGFAGLNEGTKAGLSQVQAAKLIGEGKKEVSKSPLSNRNTTQTVNIEGERFTLPSFKLSGGRVGTRRNDTVNILEVRSEEIDDTSEQIIPFIFKVYPGSSDPEFLYFRAYLESLGDNYSGNWTSTNYIGRADPIFTYDSFSRGVNFSFKIATFSKADLKPLYDKLNRLASTTAPHYEDNGFFKQGVFVQVTIGDYLQKVPGFFQSIDVNWDINYPWEVEESGRKVPHILDVNCSFQPIHNFNPQYGDDFDFIGPVEDLKLTEPPIERSNRDVELGTLTDPESTIEAQGTRFLQPV